MRIAILVVTLIMLSLVKYFSPILQQNWIPRVAIKGPGTGQWNVYRTAKSLLVSKKKYNNCHEEWFRLNPRIIMHWFDDKACRDFMRTQGERVFNAYQALRPGAYKADLFRLCILYERGGMYVDAESTPYVSIREMIRGVDSSFISILDSTSTGIHNGLIISPMGHPFLKACIERILEIVERRSYEDGSLAITGPVCMARAINEYMGREANSSFVPGLNKHAGHDLFLFVHVFGPSQNIYKADQCLLAKKHCWFSYCVELKKGSNYGRMYARRQVYDP